MEVVNVEELLQKEERTTGPIVVRINTFMTKDDFRHTAAELKQENPDIIVLPYYCELLYKAPIKCKDCKFWMRNPVNESTEWGLCFKHKDVAIATDRSDWCSWAERRTDETD